LGLIPALERRNTETTMRRFAEAVRNGVDVGRLVELAEYPSGEMTRPSIPAPVSHADGAPVRVAVASDDAFCFQYHGNWELLRKMGAEVVTTSPMRDDSLPDGIDLLILPGGYPEEFAGLLSENAGYLDSVRKFADHGLIYAECGGMMYLTRSIEYHGGRHAMAGLIDADAVMTERLQRFGYVEAAALVDNALFERGESVRAHEFHYSRLDGASPEIFSVRRVSRRGDEWTDGHALRGQDGAFHLLATYLHIDFYSCPRAAERLLKLAARDR
jgi:cobyrinic acid a,c-diamide synthase